MGKQSTKQIDRFRKAARDLETDDNEKRFNEKLGKIGQAETGIQTRQAPQAGLGALHAIAAARMVRLGR